MSPRWKRAASFYTLTFLLLALVPILQGAVLGGPLDFDAAAARASEETGLAWTSNLIAVVRLALAEPTLWLLLFGSAVPSIAALLVCAWAGPARLKELLGCFRLGLPWRQALIWCGLAAALVVAGLVGTSLLRTLLPGPEYSWPAEQMRLGLVGALATSAFLDQGALLEELGWRGFAQRELQQGLSTPLAAAVIVGVAWGLWHVPRDVVAGVVERLGLIQYLLLFLPSFVAGSVASSIIAAYFVNRCRGSLLPAILVHGLGNDAAGLSGAAEMAQALSPYHQATKALPMLLIAATIVALAGRQLGLAREPRG
jgi:membrane protease YdiL (CAAX protease family)